MFLFFYQSNGVLTCPIDIAVDELAEECKFFEIPIAITNRMKIDAGVLPTRNDPPPYIKGKFNKIIIILILQG